VLWLFDDIEVDYLDIQLEPTGQSTRWWETIKVPGLAGVDFGSVNLMIMQNSLNVYDVKC